MSKIISEMKKEDLPFFTNHLSESNPNYLNQNIYNYWISSSHNTYLPFGQIWDPSNVCYYKLILNLYFGGCIEIDTDSVSPDNQEIMITHLPTNSAKIKLSDVFKIVIDSIQNKIKRGIKSGPVILTFDNKKLVKKEQHDVFWNVLERELLNKDTYTLVSTITDDFDMTKIPISELSNKILLRWGENKNCDKDKPKVGKDLCKPSRELNLSYIKSQKRWIHLKKGHLNFRSSILDVSNNTVSVSVPLIIKKHPPNFNLIVNTQSNIMRVYPHFSYMMSQNYDNMIFFRDGVQITALNLQYLSDAWYLNSAVFMPAVGIACSPAEMKSDSNPSNKCFKGWSTRHFNVDATLRDAPLAYRLKPLWLLGLLPWPRLHNLTIKIEQLHKISDTGKSASIDLDDYPVCNVVYGLNKTSSSASKKGAEIKINNVDPTVPFFVVEVAKSDLISKLGGSKYKGGVEITWDANNLKGKMNTSLHKIRRTLSGNYNKVDLKDNCENSYMFNSRKQVEAIISFEWSPSAEIPEIKPYNDAIQMLRTSEKYKSKTVAQFLGDIELMNTYQRDLRHLLLEKHSEFQEPQVDFVYDDVESDNYETRLLPKIHDVKPTNVNQTTDE
jgi:hypothetical protein